jgi:F-type H+-transporting ATPase subunit epsilon
VKLRIVTPMQKVVEVNDVAAIRAEDETGAFGLLPGHEDFLTVLSVSVISWKAENGDEGHAAVRGGVMQVRGGDTVDVATRDAISGVSLSVLRSDVLERFRREAKLEELSKTASAKLNLAVIRQLQKYLEAGRMRIPTANHRVGDGGVSPVNKG